MANKFDTNNKTSLKKKRLPHSRAIVSQEYKTVAIYLRNHGLTSENFAVFRLITLMYRWQF